MKMPKKVTPSGPKEKRPDGLASRILPPLTPPMRCRPPSFVSHQSAAHLPSSRTMLAAYSSGVLAIGSPPSATICFLISSDSMIERSSLLSRSTMGRGRRRQPVVLQRLEAGQPGLSGCGNVSKSGRARGSGHRYRTQTSRLDVADRRRNRIEANCHMAADEIIGEGSRALVRHDCDFGTSHCLE